MGRTNSFLGEFEEMVLLAILRLRESAWGAAISEELEERAGRRVSRGALYSSLDRLEKKGFLRWSITPATSERGGQPKRRFELTGEGLEALRAVHEARVALKSGLEAILEGEAP